MSENIGRMETAKGSSTNFTIGSPTTELCNIQMRATKRSIARKFPHNLIIEIPTSTPHRMTTTTPAKVIFKKHVQADELLQEIPIKYKKKLRALIEAYENERVQLLSKGLPRTPSNQRLVKNFKELLRIDNHCRANPQTSRERLKVSPKQGDRMMSPQHFRFKPTPQQMSPTIEGPHNGDNGVELYFKRQILGFSSNTDQATIQQLKRDVQLARQQVTSTLLELESVRKSYDTLNDNYQRLIKESTKPSSRPAKLTVHLLPPAPRLEKSASSIGDLNDPFDLDSPMSPIATLREEQAQRRSTIDLVERIQEKVKTIMKESVKRNDESLDDLDYGKEKVIEKRKVRKLFRLLQEHQTSSDLSSQLQQLFGDLGLTPFLRKK